MSDKIHVTTETKQSFWATFPGYLTALAALATAGAATYSTFHPKPLNQEAMQPTSSVRLNLISAIQLCNSVYANSVNTYDMSTLKNIYEASALEKQNLMIQNLRLRHIKLYDQLINIKFEGFVVNSDGTRAEVRATEWWQNEMISTTTGNVIKRRDPRAEGEIYYMALRDGGWRIYSIGYDGQ